MGKIKRFFQKTGVALVALVASIIGVVKLAPPLVNGSLGSELFTVAAGVTVAGFTMIGCGIGKAIQSSKEKKLLLEANGTPEIENPKKNRSENNYQANNKNAAQNFNNGFQKTSGEFGQQIGQTAEKLGERIGEGANKLGIELNKIFNNQQRPNNSANPYSSTYNNSSNPYSSQDRMSAGYGGRYNGQKYNPSMNGDVRNAQPSGNTGYYTGRNNGRNGKNGQNGSNGYNRNNYNQNNYNQNNYNQNNYNQNNYNQNNNYNRNNQNNNWNTNNQNVQYGSYQNPKTQNTPNTSGLEESAKTNYFDNEPGSSSYRSGPLKKEKI